MSRRVRIPPRPPLTRHAIVAFPQAAQLGGVEAFRRRNDPLAASLPAHVTLVFPFASTLSALQIGAHVRRVAARWPVLPVRIEGVDAYDWQWVHFADNAWPRIDHRVARPAVPPLARAVPAIRVRLCAARHDRTRRRRCSLREHASRSAHRLPASARCGAPLALDPGTSARWQPVHRSRSAAGRLTFAPRVEFGRTHTPADAMHEPKTLREISCADDYDPDSMPVDRARELIRRFLTPVTATERVHIRQALGRILATDIVSPIDVPGHDNSAMDGWAVRFADLSSDGDTRLARIGESFAGQAVHRRGGTRTGGSHLHRRRSCRTARTPSSCRNARRRRPAA